MRRLRRPASVDINLKTDLERLDPWYDCLTCAIYGDDRTGRSVCVCGHADGNRHTYSKELGMERLVRWYCADETNYYALRHWDENGRIKTGLYEIQGCSMPGCGRTYVDRVYEGSRCKKCSHYTHEDRVWAPARREFILIENACKAMPRLY